MKLIRVGAAVLNQTPLDWDGNRRNILAAIDEARAARVSILCLPELALSGYGCEDAFHAPMVAETAWQVLEEILPATAGMAVAVGLPVLYQNALFNAAGLLVDGRIAGFVAKQHLAGDGLHYEPRWFKAWPAGVRGTLEAPNGRTYPLGDLSFNLGGIRIGFEICEDAWVANRPGAHLAARGVDLILNPSASHFAFGKFEIRKRFVGEGSRAFGVSYVYANLVGNEAGRAIYDGGALIATAGRLLAQGPRFIYSEAAVTAATIDVAATRMVQARTASYQPSFDEDPQDCVAIGFAFPHLEPALEPLTVEPWEEEPERAFEEFSRAVPLALFDYLRKSRAHGFVVSLSGGADSTTVSLLVAWLVRFGLAQLGRDGFRQRLAHVPGLETAAEDADLVRRLLTCVYQGTAFSSATTRKAAREVAAAVGAEFIEFEVDGLVAGYRDMVGRAIGRELTFPGDDVPLQNIQARARGPGVWLLANLRNALLLATSNRSEAAVGYATMDGDTCGGLAPIAGVDKPFIRRWLRWVETRGPHGMGPLPVLHLVTTQAPTAELRPPGAGQTDEGDLMPYEVLDAIERATIHDRQSPTEVLQRLTLQFSSHPPAVLATWIERFFQLWCRNQWKRERYAPSFHLDEENLDPRSWCRFPILSGGYRRELAALRQFAAALPARG